MGVWGTAIFSDDLACDARDGFRELIAEGLSSEDATARLIDAIGFGDPGGADGGPQWLGLAVTQWKTGRLLDSVRDQALMAIASESSERWIDPADWRKRQKVLAETAAMLRSPQRSPVRVKREAIPESPFAAGDVVRFTLDSGHEVALWALGRQEQRTLVRVSVNTPFVLLAFGEPTLAPVDELVARPPAVVTDVSGRSSFVQLHLWLPQDASSSRWAVIGNAPVPLVRQDPRGFRMPLMLRRRPGTPDQHANAIFSDYREASARKPSDASAAQLELAALMPELPRLWDGFLTGVAFEAALELAERIAANELERAGAVLELVERQLTGTPPARQIGVELIDRLLCVASHPETALERERLLALLGPAARELVPRIDDAWKRARTTERWERLEHPDPQARRRAQASCRRLADGRYATGDSPAAGL